MTISRQMNRSHQGICRRWLTIRLLIEAGTLLTAPHDMQTRIIYADLRFGPAATERLQGDGPMSLPIRLLAGLTCHHHA